MKKCAYYILALVLVAFVLSIVSVILLGGKEVLYCSPNSPRVSGVAKWEVTISPAQPPEQLDDNFFNSFVVDSNSKSLTFQQPPYNSVENSFAFELTEMALGEDIKIGGGSLELSAIGTAYLDANQVLEDDASYRIYDGRFESMGTTDVEARWNFRITENGGSFRNRLFPLIRFTFESRDIKDLMFHTIKIFDARTHKLLRWGHIRTKGENRSWYRSHIPMWHRAPIDVVLDVSYGPVKTFEFPLRAGEGFDEGIFKSRLIHVFDGVDMHAYDTSERNNMVIHQLFKAHGDRAGLCFFFACWPQAHEMPVTFEFIDKDGIVLSGRSSSSTSGNIHIISLRQPLDRVALIRAHYRTRRQHVVIHLPYIPGLTEDNDAIDNLFDVRIPYVRLHDVGQIDEFLLQTLQLRNSIIPGSTSNNSIFNTNAVFPLEFCDVTVREIANRFAQGGSLQIDHQNEQLILKYPVTLLERLEQYLEKLFR